MKIKIFIRPSMDNNRRRCLQYSSSSQFHIARNTKEVSKPSPKDSRWVRLKRSS